MKFCLPLQSNFCLFCWISLLSFSLFFLLCCFFHIFFCENISLLSLSLWVFFRHFHGHHFVLHFGRTKSKTKDEKWPTSGGTKRYFCTWKFISPVASCWSYSFGHTGVWYRRTERVNDRSVQATWTLTWRRRKNKLPWKENHIFFFLWFCFSGSFITASFVSGRI